MGWHWCSRVSLAKSAKKGSHARRVKNSYAPERGDASPDGAPEEYWAVAGCGCYELVTWQKQFVMHEPMWCMFLVAALPGYDQFWLPCLVINVPSHNWLAAFY